jgi:glycosyltransferase involved in cell wall biosynthesis
MEKIKFYATKNIVIDGRDYNPGEIVWHSRQLPGLRPAEKEVPQEVKTPRAPMSDYLGAEDPVISVVVTFHNQREFVKECLNGFARQTIKIPYEVIAIDDASKDDTLEFIRDNFPKVRVRFENFKNANKSRNAGMEIARGKYIAFFDGDDYPFAEYLEKLYDALQANPDAGFSYARFDSNRYGLGKMRLPKCNIFEWSKSWCDFSNITNTPILIRREIAPEWDEQLEIMQDAGYCLKLNRAGITGVHVRKSLWYYNLHAGGVWQGEIQEKHERAREFLKANRGMRTDIAEVLFVSLLSRDEVLDEYFEQIPKLGISNAHWLVFIDSDDENFIKKIKDKAAVHDALFLSTRFFVTGEANLAESRDFEERGMRIAGFIGTIINQARERIGGAKYIFMVEDDTIAPRNAYKKLKKIIARDRTIAYASGIECGRGFTKHTGICHLIEDGQGEIIGRDIPRMRNNGIVDIGGGGWYCWIGRTDALGDFLEKRKFRCYDGKMLGPDVMMIYDLGKMGYRCVTDLSVQCNHYDSRRRKWLPASTGKGYDITYHKEAGAWKMTLKDKN